MACTIVYFGLFNTYVSGILESLSSLYIGKLKGHMYHSFNTKFIPF